MNFVSNNKAQKRPHKLAFVCSHENASLPLQTHSHNKMVNSIYSDLEHINEMANCGWRKKWDFFSKLDAITHLRNIYIQILCVCVCAFDGAHSEITKLVISFMKIRERERERFEITWCLNCDLRSVCIVQWHFGHCDHCDLRIFIRHFQKIWYYH